MSQQVQELINKIKTEGVQQAEQQAREIEQQARHRADEIIQKTNRHAEELITRAEGECQKIRESTHMALQQASRDMLLSLRKEMEGTLKKIISHDVHKALMPERLSEIIQEAIKGYLAKDMDVADITVSVSPHDLQQLKDGFITRLKEKVKQPLHFQSAEDIGAGFTISFDKGKSCFDFTDASLVEFLSGYLNAEVSSLLKEVISS